MYDLDTSFFTEITIPQQRVYEDYTLFPSVLSPSNNADVTVLVAKIREHKPWLESVLAKAGAVLLRGFPVETASEFNDIVEAFGYDELEYIGGVARRSQVVGRVFTANESPPNRPVSFHHEMAYLLKFPSKVLFFCEVEPQKGGETPFVLSHIVYEKMKDKYPDFVDKLEKTSLVYTTLIGEDFDPASPINRGWKSTFSTNEKSVAEERAAEMGMKLEWQENGVKAVTCPIPAIRVDKRRNRKIWFNSLVANYLANKNRTGIFAQTITFEDGTTPIIDEIMEDCLKIQEEECVAIPWQKGDILLLDNLAVLHARRTFEPPRRILASLFQ